MKLDALVDYSFLFRLSPVLGLLLFLAAVLPLLRRTGREQVFYSALALFFLAAAAFFLLLGQPLAALSVFTVPAILWGLYLKAGKKDK